MQGKPLQTAEIKFDGAFLADAFEEKLAKFLSKKEKEPSRLLIDLKQVAYIDIAALSCLIAFWRRQMERDKEIYISLPLKKEVRDFLKIWRFPEALSDALGKPIQSILLKSELAFLDEAVTSYTGHRAGIHLLEYNPSWGSSYPAKRNFFEFVTFNLAPSDLREVNISKETIPRIEATRWQGELIKAVLNAHLSRGYAEEDEVSRVVVYESLANATQHPQATVIQSVSRFARRNGTDSPGSGHLTICVWDDGESIIETISKVVRTSGRLRAFRLPRAMYDRIELKLKDLDGKILNTKTVNSSDNPEKDACDEELLLASTFPGVTRRIEYPVQDVQEIPTSKFDVPAPLDFQMGMGLYTLKRTVLDLYGGNLGLRCGNLYLSVNLAHDLIRKPKGAHYRATAKRFPEHYPKFKGNLLVIRLPIRK